MLALIMKDAEMAVAIKPGWSKPSVILFASDFSPDEKAFAFALSEAAGLGADLIIFHAYGSLDNGASKVSTLCDCATARATARAQKRLFELLAQRAKGIGINCRIVVRAGLAADQILTYLCEQKIDRVVMGAHCPGPIGKRLVGSVAEAVLHSANVPVCIVGPNVVESTYRNPVSRKILCDVSKQEVSKVVAKFGAELAAKHNASLILQQVIPPQERAAVLADLTIHQLEAVLPALVPAKLLRKVSVQTRVTLGDPTEELLYQSRAHQANLIVLGAHGASHFSAVTHAGTVYKVLAFAHCPVITLSPFVLAECGAQAEKHPSCKVNFIAGVI
jgi:nucleotide-binding universal stress UspA family protein